MNPIKNMPWNHEQKGSETNRSAFSTSLKLIFGIFASFLFVLF